MERELMLSALLVGQFNVGDRLTMREVFQKRAWRLLELWDRKRALLQMDSEPIQVVITDCDGSDWSWKTLLDDLHLRGSAAQLIVTSRLADDRLWAEVLNLGGFDLLCSHPVDREELERVIASAARRCRIGPAHAAPALKQRYFVA